MMNPHVTTNKTEKSSVQGMKGPIIKQHHNNKTDLDSECYLLHINTNILYSNTVTFITMKMSSIFLRLKL